MSAVEIIGLVIVAGGIYLWAWQKRVIFGIVLITAGVLIFFGSVHVSGGF